MSYQIDEAVSKKREAVAAVIGSIVIQVGLRLFLTAWLIDIVYDALAPASFIHFTFWTALQATLLFLLVVATLTGRAGPQMKG